MEWSWPRGEFGIKIAGLIKELRPWQWYKQGVMLLGIVFSRHLFNPVAWGQLTIGIMSLTGIVGATYILNDIVDREDDRTHPTKRHRPIASGQVSPGVAGAFGGLLVLGAVLLGLALGTAFLAILLAFAGLNLGYSLYLQRVIVLDVVSIAMGYVIRAIAGVVAIGVYLSPWLILCTFLLALVLAIGKRRGELVGTSSPEERRSTLARYSPSHLERALLFSMAALLISYASYALVRADSAMVLTLPLAVAGVIRYYQLSRTEVAERPEYLFTDSPTLAIFLSWALVVLAVLYDLPANLPGGII